MKALRPRLSLRFSTLLALPITAALLAAGSLTPAAGAPARASVTLKLIQWNNPPAVAAIAAINAAFEKQYPDISVQVTSVPSGNYDQLVQTRLSAKDVDVLARQALVGAPASYTPGLLKPLWQQFADAGQFMDLTGQPFLKNYYPNALKSAGEYNGKLLSVTTGSYIYSGMYYNKTLFQKYGLSVPTTWSQLMHVASTLKSHGVAPFVDGGKSGWPLGVVAQGIMSTLFPSMTALDKGLWTGTIKYTDPKSVEVFTRTQQVIQDMLPGFMGIDYIGSVSQFAAGRAAMYPTGTWDGPAIETANPSLSFGYFQTPGSDNASDNVQYSGKYDLAWLVASHAQNKDAALKWLAFFSQPAMYTKYVNAVGIIPSEPNTKLTDAHVQALAPAAAHLKLGPDQVLHAPNNVGQYGQFFTGVVYLSPAGPISSPATLATKAQTDWNAALKLQMKKH
ncbi:MAG TPA: extracellular solute-binding protein [Chloroflexota bacterium]|nr:extracellular solute-binding protein [Chloroflexota bacterium]